MNQLSIFVGIVVLCIGTLVYIYNGMISKKNAVKAGLGNIDTELKRRFDLIPNLVETAKRYMGHEVSTLTAVVAARNDALGALAALQQQPMDENMLAKLGQAEQKLTQSIYSFRSLAESYPELKADHTMIKLMNDLTDTENRIAYCRQNYNDLVMQYNTALELFPNIFFTRMFNFSPAHTWTIEKAEEREAVRVSFG